MGSLCVFAGTSEGRELLEMLSGRGIEITACVATQYGSALLDGIEGVRVREGRMDASEMEKFLAEGGFDLVVDATHPYAQQATDNIFTACGRLNITCLRLSREGGTSADDAILVPDVESSVERLLDTDGNILLTTGSKELGAFCTHPELLERLYVRVLPMEASLRACAECGIMPDHIIAIQGPFDEDMNLAMLRAINARVLVTKDSGDAGGFSAKLRAAQRAGVTTIVIGRPEQREGLPLLDILRGIEACFPLAPLHKHVVLAGIGMGDAGTQTLALRQALKEADCLIGARRMLESVGVKVRPADYESCPPVDTADRRDVAPMTTPDGKSCFIAIAPAEIERIIHELPLRNFAVLFSGDTGFCSGARRLAAELKDVDFEVLPGIGSLQYFCAKLHRPWEDVFSLSLHGRDADLCRAVEEHSAVFVLVGGEGGIRRALDELCRGGLGECAVTVGECLGYPQERISRGSANELAGLDFDPLSVLLVENENWGKVSAVPGLPDDAFERGAVPMTKSEVRAVTLSKLMLTRRAIVWDVGTGSGSVAVEAARIARDGQVYAIERKPEALELARRNVEKFRLRNVELISGVAPEVLEALPAPTHVFIGGSDGGLKGILSAVLNKNPQARVVINAVTLETVAELAALAKEFEYSEVVQLAVNRSRQAGNHTLMTAQNPVYIFTLQAVQQDCGNDKI